MLWLIFTMKHRLRKRTRFDCKQSNKWDVIAEVDPWDRLKAMVWTTLINRYLLRISLGRNVLTNKE